MTQMDTLGRWLIVAGIAVAVIGAVLLVASRVPFLGRLPGDFSFHRGGLSFYLPLATSIVLSVILTLVANVVLRVLNR